MNVAERTPDPEVGDRPFTVLRGGSAWPGNPFTFTGSFTVTATTGRSTAENGDR